MSKRSKPTRDQHLLAPPASDGSVPPPKPQSFPIIGLGASAGGLEALTSFLKHTPVSSGAGFVIVLHLDPTSESLLVELLQRCCAMPVCEITDGMAIKPDHVYVIPPDRELSLTHGVLYLHEQQQAFGQRSSIDAFFNTLADDQRQHSVGVILSGAGSDGTLGLTAIKERAGLTAVQDPAAAKFGAMPRSALDAGVADLVASADQLPARIFHALRHPTSRVRFDLATSDHGEIALSRILVLLHHQTGHDFSLYKKTTLYRRIERRMGLLQIVKFADYIAFLEKNPHEGTLLLKELLIGVTRFFRDAEVWEHVRTIVIPRLLANRSEGGALRAWTPGCATGEEAYSLAMIFKEALELLSPPLNVTLQIFATDLNQAAIDQARRGIYPHSITSAVSAARLQRFFREEPHGFRVSKEIREMVIFAPHSLLADPPFTKLDIISCRNLMIYLAPDVHETLLPRFHFSLNPGGILLLGSSESVGTATNLFAPLAGVGQLYQRLHAPLHPKAGIALGTTPIMSLAPLHRSLPMTAKVIANLQSLTDKLLLQRYAPAAVLVTSIGDIVHISGKTGKYLEPATGKANWNVLAMAREGLSAAVSEAFYDAQRQQAAVTLSAVQISEQGETRAVDITVQPVIEPAAMQGMLMVVFADVTMPTATPAPDVADRTARQSTRLKTMEQALQSTREELQTTREEMQTSREELTSTNEELQSTNEELTTSAEELRTMNEELVRARSAAERGLARYTDLFDSAPVGYFTLERSGVISQANLAGTKLLGLGHDRPAGGRLALFVLEADRPRFTACIEQSFSGGEAQVCEVALWREATTPRTVRISALAVEDGRICRVVVVDISEIREAESALYESEGRFRTLADHAAVLIWLTGPDKSCTHVNQAWLDFTGRTLAQVVGNGWADLLHPDDLARCTQHFSSAFDARSKFSLEFRLRRHDGEFRWILDTGLPRIALNGTFLGYIGSGVDITERKQRDLEKDHERTVLEVLAQGGALPDLLERLVLSFEVLLPGMVGSILLLDPDGRHLRHGAAPHLPQAYCQAIDGSEIGPTAGSCGSAAHTGRPTMVADIANDSRWQDYQELALKHGLRACWSVPILGTTKRILGTFAFYFHAPVAALATEMAAIERGAHLASLAIERNQAEAKLAITTEMLERTGALAKVGGWELDLTTKRMTYSLEALRMTEVDPLTHMTIELMLNFIVPDERPANQARVHAAIQHGTPWDCEIRMVSAKGRPFWARSQCTPLMKDGKTITLHGTLQDITERKTAELAVRETEERYRMLWETTTDAVIVMDEHSRIAYANPAVKTIFGHEPETLIGQNMSMLQPARLQEAHRTGIARYLATGVKRLNWRATEASGLHRDGHEIPLEISFSHVSIEGRHLFAGFLRDISARVHAAAALRESEERYRHIVQTAKEGIWIIDAQAITTFVNPMMAQMLGYDPGEMLGHSLTEFMDQEAQVLSEQNLKRRQQGLSEQHDFRFRRKDGNDLWALVTTNPIHDANGTYVGAMALITDITERRRLEEELRQAHKMEAIGRLAGGIAHDFNNQLTVIQGFSAMAQTKTSDQAVGKCLAQITNAAERSADLVRQLLTFSRKVPNTVAAVNVHSIIHELLDVLGRSMNKLIRLQSLLTADDAMIQGDASLLQNAFFNLSLNARDAMPSGGDLRFATAMNEMDEVRAARMNVEMKPGSYLQVSISDTGQGMSEEVQKHLFEPFFSTKAIGQGTGLGLASVYGTITQHGGGIEVDSVPGRGTTFHIYLPRAAQTVTHPSTISPPLVVAPSTTAGNQVLVVDDEEFVAALVADTLSNLGYAVVCAGDGAKALTHYRQHWQNTDLVLLDMNMPTMGGPETFAAIRLINPSAKVVVMSGYSAEGGVEELLRQGALAFLAKPFRPETIANQVAMCLRTTSPG